MSAPALTPEQVELLPHNSHVAFYEANGYYILKEGVLPETLIDSAWEGAQHFYQGERDGSLGFDTGFSNSRPGDGDGQRNNGFVSLQKKELKALAAYPLLGTIVTGWHADRAYWATYSSDKMISVWLPLHSVDITRGEPPLAGPAGCPVLQPAEPG